MTMWKNANAKNEAEIKEKKITILLFMVYLTLIMEVMKLILMKMTLKYITVTKLQKLKNMGWKSSLKNLRKYRGCRKR